ncbi:MAG: type II CRISPR RNA-guided endonuclease Cas9 [Betaproteobacteria bacterium RBG_16_56_24]|nr:MAG: type II CRISPR RNA-guided endonuclease Cas9 [Betaproteobacteria bacterium RBG_16_56_24]
MGNMTLGLDLGTNSIGWALIDFDDNQQPRNLIACGSRIFQEAVEAKTGTPKNHARRTARAARKLVARRKQRRTKLLNLLIRHGLLPQDVAERNALLLDNQANNPYQLRKRGLDEKLEPFAFGRALYHLAHRRGFQSNRKAASDEDGKVKTAISTLRAEMQGRTLGAFLADQPTQRRRYTDRAMYVEEFEQLWSKQASFTQEQLTQALKVAIHNSIFFQRPLKSQKHLVGKCTFEPTRKRAAKAILLTQRFRILQDVNHLAVKNPITREFRPLTQDERNKLAEALDKQKSMTWGAVRKVIGWNKKDSLHEGETFNLEEGKKDKLIGNRTACDLRGALGDRWDALTAQQQDDLVTDLLTIDNTDGFLKRMKTHWEFDDATAEVIAKIELEPGYARLSAKAMRAILPYLEQGMIYSDACKAAGYDHSNPNQRTITDKLGLPSNVRNPVVQKALFETRKVVNAIVRKYGKPAVIRVEMARDMKLSKRQKEELQKEQNKQKKANELAEGILRKEFGIQQPARADIQKYNLWLECKEVCPYTGTTISREMLFSPEVDVEHILPYSRSLDDSYMNKTLCMATFNRQVKLNNTPYEIGQGDPLAYAEIFQRIKTLPFPKRRRFEQKEIETDKFIERQLNDTRYICVEVRDFLQQLGAPVEVSKGEATAKLRGRWKLNTLLSPDGSNEKYRGDHRHHAIDAVVIALTNRSLFHKLSRLSAQSISLDKSRFDVPPPWDGFYDDVYEKIDKVIVSHAPARKIGGALHEDTAYGHFKEEVADPKTGKVSIEDRFVYRKPLATLTANEVGKIRDAKVREFVEARLAQFGNNSKTAFGDPNNPLLHADGKTPIRTVRLVTNFNKATTHAIQKGQGRDYKFFKYGNNHHVEIIEHVETGKRKGIFVTAMEAARRVRGVANTEKSDIVQRNHGEEWRFVMSLSINDLVSIQEADQVRIMRVQLFDASNGNIIFRDQKSAMLDDKLSRYQTKAHLLVCQKITTDPLGNLAPCND